MAEPGEEQLDPADYPASEAGKVAEHNALAARVEGWMCWYFVLLVVGAFLPFVPFVGHSVAAAAAACVGIIVSAVVLMRLAWAFADRQAKNGGRIHRRVAAESAVEMFEMGDFLRNAEYTREEARERIVKFLALPEPNWVTTAWGLWCAGVFFGAGFFFAGATRAAVLACGAVAVLILVVSLRMTRSRLDRVTALRVDLVIASWEAE